MIHSRRRDAAGTSYRTGLKPLLGGLLLALLSAGSGQAAKAVVPAPEPPPLPAATDARGIYDALDPESRARVDVEQRVVTFAEQRCEVPDRVEMLAVSIGMLRVSPDSVISLLEKISGYPAWLLLQPSYKRARIQGSSRLIADVGSADSPKAKRTMSYDVSSNGAITTWLVADSGTALQPGSFVSFEVIPHPTIEGASLVVHRQFGILPLSGRMTKYLGDDDDKGQNHWWKDASRHAQRIHWAFDAAIRFPPGTDRSSLYVEHHQREFNGKAPYWVSTR